MTLQEFSNEFDILYNNAMSNQAPGLDEYEKSIFLTKGEKEVIKNYFLPAGNKYQEGFDGSPKRQYDFSTLIRNRELHICTVSSESVSTFDDRAYYYLAPKNLFLSLNEYLIDDDKRRYQVIPITFDEYTRMMSKPYGFPVKRQAWRLISNRAEVSWIEVDSSGEEVSKQGVRTLYEIIGRFSLSSNSAPTYHMRYVKIPKPIILVDLEGDSFGDGQQLTIDGYSEAMECELPEELHPEILQRAVEIAKSAYIGDMNTTLATGARTE